MTLFTATCQLIARILNHWWPHRERGHPWFTIGGMFHTALAPITRDLVSVMQSSSLQWRHNGRDCVSYHQPHDCLLNRLFRRRSKKTPKLRVTGLCEGNSPGTGEFPAQMASNAENVSIWWRHGSVISFHILLRIWLSIHAVYPTFAIATL